MKKRRRQSVPMMLFWNKRDQLRFIENVERLASLVNDLETIVLPAKRRRQAKTDPNAAASNGKEGS